jgi:hypothetical protein
MASRPSVRCTSATSAASTRSARGVRECTSCSSIRRAGAYAGARLAVDRRDRRSARVDWQSLHLSSRGRTLTPRCPMTPETIDPIPTEGVMEVEIPGVRPLRRGKVRTVFEAGPAARHRRDRSPVRIRLDPADADSRQGRDPDADERVLDALAEERHAASPRVRGPARVSRAVPRPLPRASRVAASSCGAPSASTSSASCAAT